MANWAANNPEKARNRARKYYENNHEKLIEYAKKYRENNPGKAREWSENNPDKVREYAKRNRQKHSEKIRADQKKWRDAHPGYARQWNREHPEAYLGHSSKWYAEHTEQAKENDRKWRQEHPEECLARTEKYRALKRGDRGSHSAADIRAIYKAQDGLCYYCGEPLGRSFHRDHKEPVSRGGSNGPDNMCCTCQFCNLSKGDKTEAEFVLSQFSNTPCQLISLAK
jgi:hypothetical protein